MKMNILNLRLFSDLMTNLPDEDEFDRLMSKEAEMFGRKQHDGRLQ